MPSTTSNADYLRARDLTKGMRVSYNQLRYIYKVYIILSDLEYNNYNYDETTGTVEYVTKEITSEISSKTLEMEWACYINYFDERETFSIEEVELIFECSEL